MTIRKVVLLSVVFFFSGAAMLFAQEEKPQIYNPSADAKADIQKSVAQAKKEGKYVLLQVGGNW